MSGISLLRRRLHQGCLSSPLNQIRHYALIGKPSQTSQKPIWSLPDSPARTRFAPSPTGYLHLGSLRTALFNYLLAQATGGQFIIRLEDTDRARFVEDAEQRLYQDLKWAGLSWDEGPDIGGPFGPYKQSDRLDLYREHASMLLDKDRAFRCFCSKEDLEVNLQQATSSGATAHYPGTCTGISRGESDRRAANGEPHIIRFKTSETPLSAPDLVYGAYRKAEREDNFIIMKSDGFPTYHFANVVDDHFMKITHVIRGAEWLISTPKHVELYNAFGWQPPNFAHVGLLVDQQRQKLSKRDIDNIGISAFRDTKILPEALLNFSVLLGWDPSLQNKPHLDKRGRLTMDELKQNFTLKFTRGDIVVDLVKLKYFQNRFIRDLISGEVADPLALSNRILRPILTELQRLDEKLSTQQEDKDLTVGMDERDDIAGLTMRRTLERTEDYIHHVLKSWKGPINDHSQFIRDNLYAFWAPSKAAYRAGFTDLQDGMRRILLTKKTSRVENTDISRVLLYFRTSLGEVPDEQWNAEVGNRAKELADAIEYYDIKKEQVMSHGAGWRFLRWGLFNGMSGLSVVPMMLLLGREETLRRLREARKIASKQEEDAAAAAREREEELARSKVRITYPGNPLGEDQTKGREAEAAEPRNVQVPIRKEEEIPSETEHFLRPMHKPRLESGPFVSKVPNRSYALEGSPPVQFLEWADYKAGYRHLLRREVEDDDEEQYAPPPLWKVTENRKQAALARQSQEAAAARPDPPEGPGPFRVCGAGEEEDDTTRSPGDQPPPPPSSRYSYPEDRPFPPEGRGPMLRPLHPVPARGPFAAGKPIGDLKAHVERIRELNEEKRIRADKRLRRDRLKQMSPSYGMKPLGGLPRDLRGPDGGGPFWLGEVADHPTRALVQLHHRDGEARARAAGAAEDERRARQEPDKEEGVSEDMSQDRLVESLQQAWHERRDQ